MKINKMDIQDEEVSVKISSCNICKGVVRTAVEHKMTTKTKNEFAKEAMKYNLNITTKSLLEFRSHNLKWCNCE